MHLLENSLLNILAQLQGTLEPPIKCKENVPLVLIHELIREDTHKKSVFFSGKTLMVRPLKKHFFYVSQREAEIKVFSLMAVPIWGEGLRHCH